MPQSQELHQHSFSSIHPPHLVICQVWCVCQCLVSAQDATYLCVCAWYGYASVLLDSQRDHWTVTDLPTGSHECTLQEVEAIALDCHSSISPCPLLLCLYHPGILSSAPSLSHSVTRGEAVEASLQQASMPCHSLLLLAEDVLIFPFLHNLSDSSFVFVLSSAPRQLHPIISWNISLAG